MGFCDHTAHEARHLGGSGGMPPQENFGYSGLLDSIWCNLRGNFSEVHNSIIIY